MSTHIPEPELDMNQFVFSFNRTNPNWQPQTGYNEAFLKSVGQFFQHKLQAQGHLFLNEILDQLGIERFRLGQLAGWMKGTDELILKFHFREDKGYFILVFDTDGVIINKI